MCSGLLLFIENIYSSKIEQNVINRKLFGL